jgi:hypothetical protein
MAVVLLQGPRAVRALVVLRRLPPAPPDTFVRAVALVLLAASDPERPGLAAIRELCDRPEPLLAGAANGSASYLWQQQGDLEAALDAARRMVAAFDRPETHWMRLMSNARVGELCGQFELGDEARRHGTAVLHELERSGDRPDAVGLRWGLVGVNLLVGDVAEAERLAEAALRATDPAEHAIYGGILAELKLVRGEVDAGLAEWRSTIGSLRTFVVEVSELDETTLAPWLAENQAVAVVAHAHDGRLDLVDDMVRELPQMIHTSLADTGRFPLHMADNRPLAGALLLALGMAELDRAGRTGDAEARRSGVRMIALAERFRYIKRFQPTMASTRARRAAEHADGPAYSDAVSEYAGLSRDELRAAALELAKTSNYCDGSRL